MIPDNGTIFYEDGYGTIYDAVWETVDGYLDITSIVSQPFIWGMQPRGYILNHRVFRYGLVTVTRQVIDVRGDSYEIIAEGSAHYFDYIQTSFMCEAVPHDNFTYHLNSAVQDGVEIRVSDGPHFMDPGDPSSFCAWPEVHPDGSTSAGTDPVLEWMDIGG